MDHIYMNVNVLQLFHGPYIH